jgi:thiol-activated cytolysin
MESVDVAIDDYLATLDHLPTQASARVVGEESAPQTSNNRRCTTQPIHETRQHDQVVALAANSASLWTGSLVRGDAVYSGQFTPIALDRAPMTISISLANLSGAHSKTLESPTLSAYREALAELLSQSVTGATPANLSVEIAKIDSEKQLSLVLGAGATWNGLVDVKGSFDWTSSAKKSRYIVKFVQSYFTVDVDAPAHASDVFAPTVGLDEVKAVTGVANPPVYVSSITYGRTVVFTFESDISSDELGGALDAVYKGPGAANGMLSVRHQDTLAQTKISAYILGGAGGEAVKAIDSVDGLMAFIRTGGDYSPQSPGAPIAYKLAHLADNEPARLSFTEDYTVANCVSLAGDLRVTLEAFEADGSDLAIYGYVRVERVPYGATTPIGTPSWLWALDLPTTLSIANGATSPSSGVVKTATVPFEPNTLFSIRYSFYTRANGVSQFLGNGRHDVDLAGGWDRDIEVNVGTTGKKLRARLVTQAM